MERLLVTGGARLAGSVRISGAKNSALKLMAAALLAPGRTVLHNVPRIQDCLTMGEVLEHLGAGVAWDGDTVTIDATTLTSVEAPYEFVRPHAGFHRGARLRCWRAPARRGSPCPEATRSARDPSTCTSRA